MQLEIRSVSVISHQGRDGAQIEDSRHETTTTIDVTKLVGLVASICIKGLSMHPGETFVKSE